MQAMPEGLLLVGRFAGVRQVTKADGTPVPRMFSAAVEMTGGDGGTFERTASFFEVDFDGEVTPGARAIRESQPVQGERVALRVRASAKPSSADPKKAFVNYDLMGVIPLDREPALRAVGESEAV